MTEKHNITKSMGDEEYYKKYRTKYDLTVLTEWCCEECKHYWYPNHGKDEKRGKKNRFCLQTGKTKLLPMELNVKEDNPNWCPYREEDQW